jgi:hypothetical protein
MADAPLHPANRKRRIGGGVGEPAGRIVRRFLPDTEVIGPPECPILYRWTILKTGKRVPDPEDPQRMIRRGPKLLVHWFPPHADDRALHDHPRPFITFVVYGGYDDLVPCAKCDGSGRGIYPQTLCWHCGSRDGLVLGERMRAGMVRRRLAGHKHRTRVGANGCWTIVLMGPLRRPWGFWKDGIWWPWREFERRFGFGMRCGDDADG